MLIAGFQARHNARIALTESGQLCSDATISLQYVFCYYVRFCFLKIVCTANQICSSAKRLSNGSPSSVVSSEMADDAYSILA